MKRDFAPNLRNPHWMATLVVVHSRKTMENEIKIEGHSPSMALEVFRNGLENPKIFPSPSRPILCLSNGCDDVQQRHFSMFSRVDVSCCCACL